MTLLLRLAEPVLTAATSDQDCVSYVSGTAVLGAFAGLYLRAHSGNADKHFDELFLEGRVCFSNLYISDPNGGITIPAPGFVAKLKDPTGKRDGERVNVFDEYSSTLTPKPLRGRYVDADLKERTLQLQDFFHHVHSGDRLLYTQKALAAEQYLVGSVTGPTKLLRELAGLACCAGRLRIGRSRTAQYGACEVVCAKVVPPVAPRRVHFKEGDIALFSLVSDVILRDGMGNAQVEPIALVQKLLGEGYTGAELDARGSISVRSVHGYNAKRGLRNESTSAFAMGSMLAVRVKQAVDLPERQVIGDRTAEGFGEVYCFTTATERLTDDYRLEDEDASTRKAAAELLNAVLEHGEKRESYIETALELVKADEAGMRSEAITSSLIGRVLLMVEQSDNADRLTKCINGIRDGKKQEIIKKLYGVVKKAADSYDAQREILRYTLRLYRYDRKRSKKGADVNAGA